MTSHFWHIRSAMLEHVSFERGPLDCEGNCWVWTGSQNGNGYGRLILPRENGKQSYEMVHILSYRLFHGIVPDGLVVDHKCRNRLCFNPSHLEAVTPKVNTLRGEGPSAHNARKTHCIRNHLLPEKRSKRGARVCLECKKLYERDRALDLPGVAL